MKIIDLLVKIANGEELPEKIMYNGRIYYLEHGKVDLFTYNTKGSFEERQLSLIIDNEYLSLNDEVAILEEPKKIEKVSYQDNANGSFWLEHRKYNSEPIKILSKKLNELIEEINKLKEK